MIVDRSSVDGDWVGVGLNFIDNDHSDLSSRSLLRNEKKEMVIEARLPAGLGVSFIDASAHELAYLWTRGVELELCDSSLSRKVNIFIRHLQV